ncbi:phosphoribosylglycinamide formyltransferase 1 [Glaciecola punicea ACAM 611]|jgi:phosphoribosylglycinamide formyltransferase-1|uniref:Phosphoribosylglycinamide formyltransferase n=1 Tax=Glaciecola punicea ACAM 611 TaxID=1121923 RepID=H5T9U5_9ALTE|nr:phosphoribosylglycinamide formyltransferase [Glaciecola punicea]OFA33368.1 phosphoribosylglycinamide formyltransferase [Glaciecola punicea]GAB55072.1 phosphoribosylglycinamide formyltransferase 1 [Glaciecola punicea ACAM 611]
MVLPVACFPKRIVVLVSGSGSNLQAIINECSGGFINGKVVAVISNVHNVYALERAKFHSIQSLVLDHTAYDSRHKFDEELAAHLTKLAPDLVVLAGFMRILSKAFVSQFHGKMLNIHPSLLPKYPGLYTHKKVIDNKDKQHGASVHFVTAELDGGPVVLQSVIAVCDNDSMPSLRSKLASTEWLIYALAVKWFCQGTLRLQQDKVWFDDDLDFSLSPDNTSAGCTIRINNNKGLKNDEEKH